MTFLIAEIAQAHDGSLGILHSYIDALAGTGINAIKFQTHIAEAESSPYETFRIKFSLRDQTRFDYWKRMEFSLEEWIGIKDHCENAGVEFISSPFSIAAVDLLEKVGVKRYKIGSGETGNLLMLDHIARTGKPIILSSGMSDWQELDSAVAFLQQRNTELAILQCTTAYPTQPTEWGLPYIMAIRDKYQLPTGFSDHSGTPIACLAAAALGVDILEFHAVFDRRMFGPDAKASLTIDEIKFLVEGVIMIEQGMQTSQLKEDNSKFHELKRMFGKSLAVNKSLTTGHVLRQEDLETKKPAGKGIPVSTFETVIGKKLKHSLVQWDFLTNDDIEATN